MKAQAAMSIVRVDRPKVLMRSSLAVQAPALHAHPTVPIRAISDDGPPILGLERWGELDPDHPQVSQLPTEVTTHWSAYRQISFQCSSRPEPNSSVFAVSTVPLGR